MREIIERVRKFDDVVLGYDCGEVEENLIELLADAMHWCRVDGLDLGLFYEQARDAYARETPTLIETEGRKPCKP